MGVKNEKQTKIVKTDRQKEAPSKVSHFFTKLSSPLLPPPPHPTEAFYKCFDCYLEEFASWK